jgi:translocation and assembly module TamB
VNVERTIIRTQRSWPRRLAYELLALLLSLFLLGAAALVVLDTAPGHRFLIDRIARIETASGLRIGIARIDGSIFGETRLRGVTVADPDGVFLTSPEIILDWSPLAWLYNNLHIDRIEAGKVRIERQPKLRPRVREGPILPGFDIEIGKLDIRRLEVAHRVSGRERVGSLSGAATIRAGRAMVEARMALLDGDKVALKLDAEPDRDRFDLAVRAVAPRDGLLAALSGVKQPIDMTIDGAGTWTRWRGSGHLLLAGRLAGELALAADKGRYRLAGTLAPAPFLKGRNQRLTSPFIRVAGAATLKDRILEGELSLASPSLRVVAKGALDLAASRYRKASVGIDLLRPNQLFGNMRGRNVRMLWTLDGPFATATYAYRLTSPEMVFDKTGFLDVRAEGRGKLSRWPMRVPLRLKARAITGVGDIAGGILRNLGIEGMLVVTPKLVRGDALKLTSDKINGKLSLLIDLTTGRFDIMLSGGLRRYAIPGLGIVDVDTELHVVPGPGGKGSRVVGKGQAWVRRLDNKFFADLMGGLPRLTTDLERGNDGVLHLRNLQLYSPKLRLSGQGIRRRDGSFLIEARGRQAQYGALRMRLDGRIERPKVELTLDAPNEALGVRDMTLFLGPIAAGYDYRATGQSRLGPFTSTGQIFLPHGGRATVDIAALNVAGSVARGALRSDPGGFSGTLTIGGGGFAGTLGFAPVSGDQQIEAHLALANASLPGPPPIAVRAGRIDGTILLAEGRTSIDGTLEARGLQSGSISLARLNAQARMVNGAGQVRATMAGRRGHAFEFVTLADVAPGRISLTGRGQVERRLLVLDSAAVLTKAEGGWALASTRLRFGGGRATVSGRTGAAPELHAEVAAMPMQLLDLFYPRLGLGGVASGRIDYRWAGRPSGRADLRVRNLSRAGLVLASKPIDLGLAAVLEGNHAAMRAVAVSDGKTVGRAQARFAPLGAGPTLAALVNAPMRMQLRYQGPVDTLWRLSGVELFDLSGPIAIGADIGGRLVDPEIRGSLKAQGARLESAVTGTVIDGLTASGRFNGSRLSLTEINGRTPGGGTIGGRGTIDFAGGSPAIDLAFDAAKARLLDRDDIQASVTGPLSIRSKPGGGGTIKGALRLDGGRFTLGRASAASRVPQLKVRRAASESEEVIELAQLQPWALDLKVAGGDLVVRGLGIDSRWRTDVDIGGSADAPRLTGEALLVRGDYEFAGRSFRLDRGIIRFRGESPPNPLLDIRAEAQVQGVDAAVTVRGTSLKPEIAFTSVPQLPQDELLSRILFGTSITNLSAPEALQLASAVAALNSGSGNLDPINAVRRAVGLDRLRILPADIATGQKTALSAGKYIGRKLFVEVISDGQGYSATRIEFQVTRWLSLLSSVSTIGRTSANVRVSKDY